MQYLTKEMYINNAGHDIKLSGKCNSVSNYEFIGEYFSKFPHFLIITKIYFLGKGKSFLKLKYTHWKRPPSA